MQHNQQRLALQTRYQQLLNQGNPVLGGLEIAIILRDEGYAICDVACTMMEYDERDYAFAVYLTMADSNSENTDVLLVSDTQVNPYEWINATSMQGRQKLNRVEWNTVSA